jgi:hypothetical protein
VPENVLPVSAQRMEISDRAEKERNSVEAKWRARAVVLVCMNLCVVAEVLDCHLCSAALLP